MILYSLYSVFLLIRALSFFLSLIIDIPCGDLVPCGCPPDALFCV